MNFKNMPDLRWMAGRSNLTLVFYDDWIDAVWMEQSLLGPSVKLMERFSRAAAPEQLAEKIRAAEKTPARVLVCPPRSLVMQRTLFYPAAVRADLSQMLQFEAAKHVPVPDAERRIAFSSAPAADGKQIGVNLLAARAGEITELLAPFRAAGIPVDEVIPLSSLLAPPADSPATLMIFDNGGETEFVLYVNGLLQDSFTVKDASSFVDSIRRIIARHRELLGAEGIGKIIYSGINELSEETRHAIEGAFGLHVQLLDVPEALRSSLLPETPALTAALCAAGAAPEPSLNLIDRSGRKVPPNRRTLILAGLAALLLIELFAGWMVRIFSPSFAIQSAERESAALRRRAAPIAEARGHSRDIQNEMVQLNDLIQSRVSVMSMLKTVSETLPTNTYLQAVDYSRGKSIQLRGRSKEPDQIPQLIMSLPFTGAIDEWSSGEKTDDYYNFRITAAIRSSTNESN